MGEVKTTYRRCWQHGEILCQRQTGVVLRIEEIEQDRFERVVGAGRIAGCRANTAIFFLDQRLIGQLLIGCIAPKISAQRLQQNDRQAI